MITKTRRGIHSLVAVSLLIGLASVMAAAVASVLLGQVGNLTGSIGCEISDIALHETGAGRAYFAASIYNTGTVTVDSAAVWFLDDDGTVHGLNGTALDPGDSWKPSGTFAASVADPAHMVRATITSEDGSVEECSVVYGKNHP